MAKEEPHPTLKMISDAYGAATSEDLDTSMLRDFVCLAPLDRSAVMHQTSELASRDDGVHLRKKAQFLDLSRKLHDVDAAMRKSGR